MALSFARLWKNEEHSDVDVVFKVTSHSGDETAAQQLSHFPGHSVLLSSSPMISAQVSSLGIRKHSQLLQLCVCKPLQCMCLGVCDRFHFVQSASGAAHQLSPVCVATMNTCTHT